MVISNFFENDQQASLRRVAVDSPVLRVLDVANFPYRC